MVDKKQTPLPGDSRFAPTQIELADWFDLSANSDETRLDLRQFGDHAIDVRKVGGRPETNVSVDLSTTRTSTDGRQTETDTFDTTALYSFGNVSNSGPFANERLQWTVKNRSNTDYTQGGNDAYQAHINYVVRRMSALEKMRRDVPLDGAVDAEGPETELAREFNLDRREEVGLPVDVPAYLEPGIDEKVVRELESEVATVDVDATGAADRVAIASESQLRDRGVVVYATGLKINSQDYASTDNLKVRFTRSGTDDFYDLETYGMPGFAAEYAADLHIPFVDQMNVSVWADNNAGNTTSNVDVQVEYAVVERTLLEKALYGLRNEAEDVTLFDQVQRQVQAGVPVNLDPADLGGAM